VRFFLLALFSTRTSRLSLLAADDYSAFSAVWSEPDGGLHGYLVRFLESEDTTFQHIAIWTLVQLLESQGASLPFSLLVVRSSLSSSTDTTLEQHIRNSPSLLPLVKRLATSAVSSRPSSVRASSDAGEDDDLATDGGEREIVELAKTAFELIDPDEAAKASEQ
jgi:hypothetical protein